jgi:hypothetical protein
MTCVWGSAVQQQKPFRTVPSFLPAPLLLNEFKGYAALADNCNRASFNPLLHLFSFFSIHPLMKGKPYGPRI